MNGKVYQELAMKFSVPQEQFHRLINAALGLSGESGRLMILSKRDSITNTPKKI